MRAALLALLALLGAAALCRAARQEFQRLSEVLVATASLTLPAGSQLACAGRCRREQYALCTAYSFADNGTCWLFPQACLMTEPSADHPGVVSYVRPPEPTRWCPVGAVDFRNTCFTRHVTDVPLTWYAAQEACRALDACSHLATPSNKLTYLALFQFYRPNALEWIGAEDLDGDGIVGTTDGGGTWTPPLVSLAAKGPVLLPTGYRQEVHRTTPTHGAVHRYVCESKQRCRVGKPCPDGWFMFDRYCYLHIAEARTWDNANAHCASLGPGGRLASPWNNAIWSVLWQQFFSSNGGHVYMGAYDTGHEGSWRTLDGGNVHVSWSGGQPDNAGGIENCLEMIGQYANDIPCHAERQSICRVDAQLC